MRYPNALASFFLAAASAVSQSPSSPVAIEPGIVPIHRGVHARGEVWAAGAAYKVRLDGRFEFFPALGSAYPHNLPLAWSTERVTLGGHSLRSDRAAEHTVGDRRYEYDWEGVVEAYDVALDSVEQTFRIEHPPRAAGPLVVVGKIETPLRADPVERVHGSIAFRDADGTPIVEYGAATAIDAAGRTLPMTTSFADGRIELRLDAASVARAEFPVVVDPVVLNANPTQEVGQVAMATLDLLGQIGPRTNFVAHTRVFSASDHDLLATMAFATYSSNVLVYADLSSSYSNEQIAAVAQSSESRFVVAAEQRQGFRTHLSLYAHHALSTTLNNGTAYVLSAANGQHFRNPSVGGTYDSSLVLVACDHTLTSVTTVRALLWDSDPGFVHTTLGTIAPTTGEVFPAVTPHAGPDWLVAWPDNDASPSVVNARRVTTGGLVRPTQGLVQSGSRNYSQVLVAGGGGRYLATYRTSPTGIGIAALRALRFDWDGGTFTALGERSVHSGQLYTNRGLAYDDQTRSHWCTAFNATQSLVRDLHVTRLGFAGAITETVSVGPSSALNPYPASVAFGRRPSGDHFTFAYAPGDAGNTVYGDVLEYPAAVYDHVLYGTGCSALPENEDWTPAIAGSQFFTGTLESHAGAVAALMIGQLTTSLPLDAIGMPGCELLVEPALSVSVPAALNAANDPFVTLLLPNSPLFQGAVYTQWLLVQPGTNALGVVAHAGRAHTVL